MLPHPLTLCPPCAGCTSPSLDRPLQRLLSCALCLIWGDCPGGSEGFHRRRQSQSCAIRRDRPGGIIPRRPQTVEPTHILITSCFPGTEPTSVLIPGTKEERSRLLWSRRLLWLRKHIPRSRAPHISFKAMFHPVPPHSSDPTKLRSPVCTRCNVIPFTLAPTGGANRVPGTEGACLGLPACKSSWVGS